jgi:hypothetical protein
MSSDLKGKKNPTFGFPERGGQRCCDCELLNDESDGHGAIGGATGSSHGHVEGATR